MTTRTLHKPPAPDPCIVSSSFVSGYFFNRSREKAMVKARSCPYGCGLVCKGLLPLPGASSK